MIFEYQTKKTFDEIIESLNQFKKLQNDNLFGFIEEFDFQNIEFDSNKIIVNRNNISPYSFLNGKGAIEYTFQNKNIIEITLQPNKLFEKGRKFNIIVSIIFLIIINLYSSYLYKEIKYTFIILSVIIILLQFLFFKILDQLNLYFLKIYAIKFYRNLEKQ